MPNVVSQEMGKNKIGKRLVYTKHSFYSTFNNHNLVDIICI